MTSFLKFISDSKAYLMVNDLETLNRSKVSCFDQNYTLANLTEKEVDFVEKKFLFSTFENLKFFVKTTILDSSNECYNLLTKYHGTVSNEHKCPDDYDYTFESQTLCEKEISGVYNATSIDSYPTTQIIHTSNNTLIIIVIVIISAVIVVVLIIVALYFFKRRRSNNNSNEVI